MKWHSKKSTAENAAMALPELAGRFFTAGNVAAKPNTSLKQLHQFRVWTKRFRYTLELFRPCYGPGLSLRLETLKEVQQSLGELNDFVTIRGLVPNGPLKADLDRKIRTEKVRFRELWTKRFGGAGEIQRWETYLKRTRTSAERTV